MNFVINLFTHVVISWFYAFVCTCRNIYALWYKTDNQKKLKSTFVKKWWGKKQKQNIVMMWTVDNFFLITATQGAINLYKYKK